MVPEEMGSEAWPSGRTASSA